MNTNEVNILIFAFRYALTRETAAVDIVVQELITKWENLSNLDKDSIQREIKQQFNFDTDMRDYIRKNWEIILRLDC